MPVPGAPAYTLANLEHAMLGAITPTRVIELRDVGYYGWFGGRWLVFAILCFLIWQRLLGMKSRAAPLAGATNNVTAAWGPADAVATRVPTHR